jgi:assimilatory nitrate reductase catalytic subunit
VHEQLAQRLGLGPGDWATARTRRGAVTMKVEVVKTIRPDTVFIPYHWPGERSANALTIAAQDPISKIPEYKVCAVHLQKAERP